MLQTETKNITVKLKNMAKMTITKLYNNWFWSVVAIHRPGENPMETLHEGKTQINSVWIEIGAQSTGSDMNEWKVKKKVYN